MNHVNRKSSEQNTSLQYCNVLMLVDLCSVPLCSVPNRARSDGPNTMAHQNFICPSQSLRLGICDCIVTCRLTCSRNVRRLRWPFDAARCEGVSPEKSSASMSAPRLQHTAH